MRAPVKQELSLFLITSHHDRLEPVLSGFPFCYFQSVNQVLKPHHRGFEDTGTDHCRPHVFVSVKPEHRTIEAARGGSVVVVMRGGLKLLAGRQGLEPR
jgi:hypothetical protein